MNIQASNSLLAPKEPFTKRGGLGADKEEAAKKAPNVYLDDESLHTKDHVSYREKVREAEEAAAVEGYRVNTGEKTGSAREAHVKLSKAMEEIRGMEQGIEDLEGTLQELRTVEDKDGQEAGLQEEADKTAQRSEEDKEAGEDRQVKEEKQEGLIKNDKSENARTLKTFKEEQAEEEKSKKADKKEDRKEEDRDEQVKNFVEQFNVLLDKTGKSEENDKVKQFYEKLKNEAETYEKELADMDIHVEEDGSLSFAKGDNANQVKKVDAKEDALAKMEETVREAREQKEKYLPDTYLSYNQEQNYNLLAATGALFTGTM